MPESDAPSGNVLLAALRIQQAASRRVERLGAFQVRPPEFDGQVIPDDLLASLGGRNNGGSDNRAVLFQAEPDRAVRLPGKINAHFQPALDRLDVGVGGTLEVDDMRAAGDDEPDVVPDAGLNDSRDPVPRVVIARLPLGYDRRHAALPQPPRRQIEDNVNHVLLRLEHVGQMEAIRRVRAAKPANLLVVHHHPTGIVQPKTLQVNVGARLHPSVRNRGVADPVAVLDPFRFPRFEGLVPVGDDAGGQQGGLHRAGHLHRHRWHVGLMHSPCPFVPPRQFPEMRHKAGHRPLQL